MFPVPLIHRAIIVAITSMMAQLPALFAQTPEQDFYHAYYLHHAQHEYATAADLYGDFVAARQTDPALRAEAKAGLAACREELATADFARLMPPNPLAYVEINRPGERLGKLIDALGLLAEPGTPPPTGENRLAISPAVLDAVLGMRGIAAAVTGFDMAAEKPSGVAVFHPGDMELVRGLIQTALPAATTPVKPVDGYATYEVEDILITLTSRLVIVGTSPGEISGVIDRMKSPHEESLATNRELAEIMEDRDGSLLYFCVNPKPLMPLLTGMLAAGATQSRELALTNALVDLKSLRAMSGRFDVSDEGIRLDVTLRLDKGHRNLVYNFLRRPAIDPATLRCVPAGAAGVFAVALNEAPDSYRDLAPPRGDEPPVVTALDIGRELFANINGVAVFALPPASSGHGTDAGLPDIAAVITVDDPAMSRALWGQILGIASIATGGFSLDGTTREIEGVDVQSYHLAEADVSIQFAAVGHQLFIASTDTAIAQALQTKRSGDSILDDKAYAHALSNLGPHTTVALMAHPQRCAEIAKPFMSPSEVKEMEPVVDMMKDTVVAVMINHSDQVLRFSAAVSGVPKIGDFVSKMITQEIQRDQNRQRLSHAVRTKDWDEALTLLDEQLADQPNDYGKLRSKFNVLAVHQKKHAAAVAFAEEMLAALHDDANALNSFAWGLLTEDKYGHDYADLALRFSRRSNELTAHENWAYLDTLALAEFETGNASRAVELEEKALDLCHGNSGSRAELEKALARFRGGAHTE